MQAVGLFPFFDSGHSSLVEAFITGSRADPQGPVQDLVGKLQVDENGVTQRHFAGRASRVEWDRSLARVLRVPSEGDMSANDENALRRVSPLAAVDSNILPHELLDLGTDDRIRLFEHFRIHVQADLGQHFVEVSLFDPLDDGSG